MNYHQAFIQLAIHGLERQEQDLSNPGEFTMEDLAYHARYLIDQVTANKADGIEAVQQGEQLSAELESIAKRAVAMAKKDGQYVEGAVVVVGTMRLLLDQLFEGRAMALQPHWKALQAIKIPEHKYNEGGLWKFPPAHGTTAVSESKSRKPNQR